MDQPPLPDIKPYVNRNLFSDHFLDELLPQDDLWDIDEDELKLAMQATTNLYARKEWVQACAELRGGPVLSPTAIVKRLYALRPSVMAGRLGRRPPDTEHR